MIRILCCLGLAVAFYFFLTDERGLSGSSAVLTAMAGGVLGWISLRTLDRMRVLFGVGSGERCDDEGGEDEQHVTPGKWQDSESRSGEPEADDREGERGPHRLGG